MSFRRVLNINKGQAAALLQVSLSDHRFQEMPLLTALVAENNLALFDKSQLLPRNLLHILICLRVLGVIRDLGGSLLFRGDLLLQIIAPCLVRFQLTVQSYTPDRNNNAYNHHYEDGQENAQSVL